MHISRLISYVAICVALISSCESIGKEKLQGSYYFSVEDESFIPCGSSNAFWITGSHEALEEIHQTMNSLRLSGANSSSPIFIEITATDKGKAKDGFAMDYESVYEVHSARIISKNVPAYCTSKIPTERDI